MWLICALSSSPILFPQTTGIRATVHDGGRRKDQSRKVQRRELQILEDADRSLSVPKRSLSFLGGKAQKLKKMTDGE